MHKVEADDHPGQLGKKRRAPPIAFWTVLVALALIWLISFFLPGAVSLSWHVLHGNAIQFESWDVPVPWGWWMYKEGQGIVIQRLRRGDNPASNVFVTTLGFRARSIGAEQWKKARIKVEVDRGQQLLSDRGIQMDGENGFCLTFVPSNAPDDRSVICDFATHDLSFGYSGPKDDIYILDRIIPNIRPFR